VKTLRVIAILAWLIGPGVLAQGGAEAPKTPSNGRFCQLLCTLADRFCPSAVIGGIRPLGGSTISEA
jgi:hypothetical protein